MPLAKHMTFTAVVALISCQDHDVDPFLDSPRDQWVEKASQLETREIYRLYKQSIDAPKPWDARLAEALGPRGRDAILVWADDLESGRGLNRIQEFSPIFHYVYESTGYSICNDHDLFLRASRAINRGYRINLSRDGSDLIRAACRR